MAVKTLYPHVQLATGPWTEHGFHYDFYFPNTDKQQQLSVRDLKPIKKEMDKIIRQNLSFRREELTSSGAGTEAGTVRGEDEAEATRRVQQLQDPYKMEILADCLAKRATGAGTVMPISIYHLGEKWWDLCAVSYLTY